MTTASDQGSAARALAAQTRQRIDAAKKAAEAAEAAAKAKRR
ncbi:hypothetical protein [Streptomyces sp. NPDC088258]